ncbi:glycosyltransferase [Pararhodospirillum photometricum]|uniref:glycosyltransferase n=1 Tax=Pararhodospirillum photometricum TaxID=1084 RepID=UPI0002EEE12D|nr:glycosyltransferase [Pararhodospirillum photometricum]
MMTPPPSFSACVDHSLAAGRFAEARQQALALLADEERHLDGILARTRCALAEDDVAEALRWAERAFRYNPKDIGTCTFYAAVALRAGQCALAVSLLSEKTYTSPTPGIVLGWSLRRLGETKRLLLLLSDLLGRFPPSLAPALEELANQTVIDDVVPGWAAPDVGGRIVGVLGPSVSPDAWVRVFCDTAELMAAPVSHLPREPIFSSKLDCFSLTFADHSSEKALLLTLEDAPLLGMPAPLIVHPVVEGGVTSEGEEVRGWAWMPADPSRPVAIRIVDERGHAVTLETNQTVPEAARLGIEDGPHGFLCDPLAAGLMPGRFWILAGDGQTPLVGSPICIPARRTPIPVAPPPPRKNRSMAPTATVDILVPVYGARQETLACLSSLFESLSSEGTPPHEIIAIDDAGPDPRLCEELARLGAAGRLTFLSNEHTLGFPKTVNRGLALHPDRDVVLLNADTLVAGDWLRRLQRAAYAHPETVSVNPFIKTTEPSFLILCLWTRPQFRFPL